MQQPELTYDEQAQVFALISTDLHGIERVELFTAPGVGPFNVYNADLSAARADARNSKAQSNMTVPTDRR